MAREEDEEENSMRTTSKDVDTSKDSRVRRMYNYALTRDMDEFEFALQRRKKGRRARTTLSVDIYS